MYFIFCISGSFPVIVKLDRIICLHWFILLLPISPKRGYKKSPKVQITRLMIYSDNTKTIMRSKLFLWGVWLDHSHCLAEPFLKEQHWGYLSDNWMSFSFASQDSLSPWHHIVEIASLLLSVSLPLSLLLFLVELLSLMNGVVTEAIKLTHTAVQPTVSGN